MAEQQDWPIQQAILRPKHARTWHLLGGRYTRLGRGLHSTACGLYPLIYVIRSERWAHHKLCKACQVASVGAPQEPEQ